MDSLLYSKKSYMHYAYRTYHEINCNWLPSSGPIALRHRISPGLLICFNKYRAVKKLCQCIEFEALLDRGIVSGQDNRQHILNNSFPMCETIPRPLFQG